MERLTLRALNRATLARQHLLERKNASVIEAIRHLAGLNAQYWASPYISLWSRLQGFQLDELTQAIEQRAVARATVMRSTLHLVTARDYLLWQPALQGMLLRAFRGYFKEEAGRIDLDWLCAAASGYLAEEARTFPELRAHLSGIEPGEDPASLSFGVRAQLPLVQVPPAGPGVSAEVRVIRWPSRGSIRESPRLRRDAANLSCATWQPLGLQRGETSKPGLV